MSVEENKACVRGYIQEALNEGHMEVLDECLSKDWTYLGPFGEFKGPEGFRQMFAPMKVAFPDLHYTIGDMAGEEDKLFAKFTMTGTFKGEFMGNPPNGNTFEMSGVYFYRFKDGKETEATPFIDTLSLYQQLGIKPPGQ